MKFEEVVSRLGDFGRYQRLMYIIPCYASICAAIHGILSLYTLHVPNHRCRIPELGSADSWATNASIVGEFVPTRHCGDGDGESGSSLLCFDQCLVYFNGTNATVGCPLGWVYDTSEFVSTFATENDFVCSRDRQLLLTSVAQSYFYGLLAGSLITGFISDRFGRRVTLFVYLMLQGLTGLISGLVSGVVEFWILRFTCGLATSGVFPAAFVIGIEFVGPSMRLHAGFIIEYVYTVGLLLAALFALWFRHWRWLTVASSCVSLVSIVAAFFLPESPRWLVAVGRYPEAERIIRRAARVNGVQLPTDLRLGEEGAANPEGQEGEVNRESCLSVFRYRRLVGLFANVVFQWFVVSLVYQGLSLGSGSLPGSIFLTSSLNALSESGGYLMAHLMLLWLGRKRPHIFSMAFCGLVLIGCVFPALFGGAQDLSGLYLTLALLGKVGISGAFGIVYLWTAEQIPTSMRQRILGVASLSSRIGYAIGPLIVDLNKFVETSFGNTLPLLLYGVCSLTAGLTAVLMPETAGRNLPETLSEGDQLMKLQGYPCSRGKQTGCVTPVGESSVLWSSEAAGVKLPAESASSDD